MSEPDIPPSYNPDRKRGILTKRDREVVMGRENYENKQQLRDARYRIRQRLIAALLDIQLLGHNYPLSEHSAVVETMYSDKYQPKDEGRIFDYVMNLFDFSIDMATAAVEYGHIDDLYSKSYEDIEKYLEQRIRTSIESTNKKHGDENTIFNVEVNIDIDKREFDEDEAIKHLIRGSPSFQAVITYLENGDVEKLRERMEQMGEDIVLDDGRRIEADNPFLDHTVV